MALSKAKLPQARCIFWRFDSWQTVLGAPLDSGQLSVVVHALYHDGKLPSISQQDSFLFVDRTPRNFLILQRLFQPRIPFTAYAIFGPGSEPGSWQISLDFAGELSAAILKPLVRTLSKKVQGGEIKLLEPNRFFGWRIVVTDSTLPGRDEKLWLSLLENSGIAAST